MTFEIIFPSLIRLQIYLQIQCYLKFLCPSRVRQSSKFCLQKITCSHFPGCLAKKVFYHMGVSENSGTSKSSILIGFSTINHPFWGSPSFGNTHITSYVYNKRSSRAKPFFCETSSQTCSLNFCWGCVWLSGPKNPTQRGYDQPQPPKNQSQKPQEIPPWHPTSSWHRSFRLQPAPLDLQEP